MRISYDPVKRAKTLAERGLDFESYSELYRKSNFTYEDERYDYGEERFITVGYLNGRMIIAVWTPRGKAHHIISMRKANEKEQKKYQKRMD